MARALARRLVHGRWPSVPMGEGEGRLEGWQGTSQGQTAPFPAPLILRVSSFMSALVPASCSVLLKPDTLLLHKFDQGKWGGGGLWLYRMEDGGEPRILQKCCSADETVPGPEGATAVRLKGAYAHDVWPANSRYNEGIEETDTDFRCFKPECGAVGQARTRGPMRWQALAGNQFCRF